MSSNIVRADNLTQVLALIKPTFEELAKVHNVVNFRQEADFALTLMKRNSGLLAAAIKDQDAFRRAIINIASIGLTINPALGLAYLIPRKGIVTYDISYKGKIALGVECGSIKFCLPELVYEKDVFKRMNIDERPLHEFDPFDDNRGNIRGGYAVSKTNNGEYLVTYMSLGRIHKIRSKSDSYKKGNGSPWETDEEEMIKKTLIRRNSKAWPHASTHDRSRLDAAISLEEENDPLPELTMVDNQKRAEQFEIIKDCLLRLNFDEEYYINETLCKITRRKIEKYEDLTDLEIDQILIQLHQLCEELPNENNK